MTVETQAKITITAEDHATAVVRKLRTEVEQLTKSLAKLTNIKIPAFQTSVNPGTAAKATEALTVKSEASAMATLRRRWSFENRMSRQRATEAQAEDRQRKSYESAAMADIKRRMALAGRMARQHLAELRFVERERERAANAADRDAASALRRQIAGDRWRFALRNRMDRQERTERERTRRETIGRGQDAFRYGRDAVRDVTRPVGVAALAGSAAAGAATRKILTSESAVDAAEINTRSYGGLSQEAARSLRDGWAAPVAETLGAETAKLLTAWTDAVKLGIPAAGAKGFAELATKTSAAWEVPFETVTDIMGTINTILTSKGEAFNLDRLKSAANTIQHLAAKQSTTPEKLLSFLQRGAGAAQVLGMSQEAGLAFGSASTSLGNQAGQSGRLFDYIASRVIELPRLTKGNGDQAKRAKDLVRDLGYGSADQMQRQRLADPDAFLPDLLGRFNRIKDKKKQDEAIAFFAQREWLGELGRMVKGIDTYNEAVKLSKEAKGLDSISEVWNLHRLKLSFVFKQFRSGWLNILGEFGKVLSPMARVAGDYFLAWSSKLRNGGLQLRFKAAIDGLLAGLGFNDLGGLLTGIFGKPGEGNAGAVETWRVTFQEFGAGIRDVVSGIKGLISSFTGGSPETLARWTGRILTLSAALIVLSPVLTILGGLASGLLAVGTAAATVLSAFKVAGLVGGTGAAGAIGTGALAAAGGIIGVAFLATIADRLGILKAPDVSKGWGRGIMDFLDPGIASRILGDDQARVEKQSLNGGFDRSMIHKASLVTDELVDGLERLGRTLNDRMGAKVQAAAFSAPSISAFTGSGGGTGGGAAPSGVPGFPGVGAPAGGGPRVPGWFGRGRSTGAGNGMPDPGTGAGTGPYKGILDHIAQSEGTAGRGDYHASLGYGRYLPGRKETNLTGKSLNEILALGNHMRRQPGNPNSSALGRYQIVGQTLRRLMGKLGLKGDEKFDEALQDRLGAELVRGRGTNATGLGQEWASLRGGKLAKAVDLARGIPQGASTTAGPREAVSGGVHPLDGKGRFTSDFGMRRHPITGALKMHNGVDLAAPAGTVVKAMRDGIASIDRSGDVMVKGEDGMSTTYRHIQAEIEAGARVAAGQAIGRLRAHDPRSTGPHLHLEARGADGKLIDPKGLLSAKAPAASPDQAGDIVRPGQGFGATPNAQDLTSKVPMPATRGRGVSDVPGLDAGGSGFKPSGSGGGSTITVNNVIHAGNQNPQELAGHVQRHITEAWNYRSHDLEPELT